MDSLPLNPDGKKEWNTIQTIAKNNGFSIQHIRQINQQIQHNNNNTNHTTTTTSQQTKIRTTFAYFSPLIRTINNLFKHTNLQITYKTTNTIQQLFQHTPHQHRTEHEKNGMYKLSCTTCKLSYIVQTTRTLQQRYKEHTRYIKYNDPQSAYALHILNNRYEYGTLTDTMKLVQHITNPTMLLPYEQFFIHSYRLHKHLTPEQNINDINPPIPDYTWRIRHVTYLKTENQYLTITSSSFTLITTGRID